MTNFRTKYEVLKTGATVIRLESQTDKNHIDVAHFPGHYYPVEIPTRMKVETQMFINGLRANKLFKNRKWFFDGRLYPFNTKGSIDILQNHLDMDNIREIFQSNRTRLEEYINDMEYDQEEFYEEQMDLQPMTDLQLKTDLLRQDQLINQSMSIKDMFNNAATELLKENVDWNIAEYTSEGLMDSFKDDTGVENFVRALGENKQRKKRDFYMITNLRLNVNFINRVLDLFFKGNSILSEPPRELPNYALHCKNVRLQAESDTKLIDLLYNYICARIGILVGHPTEYVHGQITQLEKSSRNYNTLNKLNRYLTRQSPTLFDMLDQGAFEGQDSDTEGELDF